MTDWKGEVILGKVVHDKIQDDVMVYKEVTTKRLLAVLNSLEDTIDLLPIILYTVTQHMVITFIYRVSSNNS